MNVLLVDDSAIFRTRMKRRLEEESGVAVLEAANGFEGLVAIEQSRPDVVILDLQMPGLDGSTVLGEIRERFGDLPVIVLTANATPVAREQCERLGVDAVVDKADAASAVVPLLFRASERQLERGV